jgi:hypothetical protein
MLLFVVDGTRGRDRTGTIILTGRTGQGRGREGEARNETNISVMVEMWWRRWQMWARWHCGT